MCKFTVFSRWLIVIPSLLCLFILPAVAQQKKYYESKIERCLDKEKALQDYYLLDSSGITIYASAQDKRQNNIEFKIFWNEITQFNQLAAHKSNEDVLKILYQKKEKPFIKEVLNIPLSSTPISRDSSEKKLKGIRIAIDPGHIARDMTTAKMEKKFVCFKADSLNQLPNDLELIEGRLTLTTALLLRKMLEEQGAEVLLTRDLTSETAFGISYEEWLEKRFRSSVDSSFMKGEIDPKERLFLLTRAKQSDIFRLFFTPLEMKERIRKINAFKPALTVIIHYNVDEKNTGWRQPTKKNFNMVFIGGSFLKSELSKPEDRLAFLRLLLGNDIENSAKFSGLMIKSFAEHLQVNPAKLGDADYLQKHCMATEHDGVYSRNLLLTRYITGTLAYGETLYQDNVNECLMLSKDKNEFYGIKTAYRVKQVAEAYYEGIINYLEAGF